MASKSGGVGGGSGSGSRSGSGGSGRGGKAKPHLLLLRGEGVAVAGQREWRWASSICPNNPCLSPFYPQDWAEGEAAEGARREEEARAEREDARRPPGKKKKKIARSIAEAQQRSLFPPSFAVARTWQQVREALRGEEEGGGKSQDFVPAALWPERRGTLAAGSRVFLLRSSSSTPSPSSYSTRGELLGAVTTAPPRGCPPGVAAAAGLLRARALWRARFAGGGGTKKKEKEEDETMEEKKKKKKRKSKRPHESSVRVIVVLPDGREVSARAAPSGVAASLW